MKINRLLPLLALAGITSQTAAQTTPLYQPRDIKAAFAKGTRSPDGRPGPNYWQNHARYNITVQAAPPARDIRGRETITYYNNSPDTLRQVVLRIIQNIHKPGASRDGDASADYLTSGVVIDTFQVAGQLKALPTNLGTAPGVRLPKALAPHDSVKFAVAWHFPISVESGREGMIDPTTYFLAYFYPRIAVYDDYNGWDRLPFVDSKEFYNDFNDYTLRVQAPANYIVWATGTLQNPDQVLQKAAAKRLKQSMTSDAVLHIATAADLAKKSITAQQPLNTWIWTAKDISDVTFGLSDHYVWDAASVVVDAKAKRRASVQAAYADSTVDFRQSVKNAQYALGWFSNPNNWPGVAYPFPKMTAFQGFADMEYPMMVNDSPQKDPKFAQFVQDHEIAHTYFPFYMGINESRYAYMDEGWATTFELLIGRTENGVEAADKLYKMFRVNRWINDRATAEDLPIITPSSELRAGYGNNAYGKPSLSYLALKDMLGDALFKKSLHEYMDRWHGKHPIPWDYFNSMSNASGQDLSWFFNNWFFTNNYIDLAVTANGSTVTVQNIGGFAVPFDMNVEYTDGSKATLHQSPAVWQANQKQAVLTLPKAVKSVKLDGGIFMDANEKDNSFGG
ncbi:M1 family metallopeptidase [Hymenobacter negativus]|uniref:M1 family metallopeptidase n=1 Tax=Hymenobacter negativus TaxID=2795026 RepID=A0ABS0Q5V2_9BACT|nr:MULTISPECIES: M1 family metallopeptidase [Bacteria]MBH8558023.1 M1 family metallopeptidase [Hymenobacter negativus]MBH8568513.1 M1 family metallopeptidase [Hymenobacter negativus]MBR7208247.1 M1 family metallopeptidase [Microvirga sp. STS02]